MSSISTSSGEGSIRSSRRPDSMRCQARARLRFTTAALAESDAGRVAVAVDEMIVDHADGLHERVDDRRPDEIAAALLQVLRMPRDIAVSRRNVAHASRVIDDRPAVDEAPEMAGKAAAVAMISR